MATEEAPKEAPARLVDTILQQKSAHLDTVIKNIDTKDFYKVVNATPQYFVEVGKENDTMVLYSTPGETAPIMFNKLKLELDDGNRWFMFTVKDVMIIKKYMSERAQALPEEAKAATLDWTTLNDKILNILEQKMLELHGFMSLIVPSKDTYMKLDEFWKKLSTTVKIMGALNYPNDIQNYLESAMVWVLTALVVAAEDNVINEINHLNDRTQFYRNKQARLRDIRSTVDSFGSDGYNTRLNDEEKKIYDNFRNPNIRSLSDQDIDDVLYGLKQEKDVAIKKKNDVKNILNNYFIGKQITRPPSVSDALKNVEDKIRAIKVSTNFNPWSLYSTIKDLISILSPNKSSNGGRRRTNKKRSTRRKKKRGKKRRSYRTKR